MKLTLLRPKTMLWPTALGWFCIIGSIVALFAGWGLMGESFLSLTKLHGNDVLVVEGWIGPSGVTAAQEEFRRGGYRLIVATGGLTGVKWDSKRWSYAVETEKLLNQKGIKPEQIVLAVPHETGKQRTFESALAVKAALSSAGIKTRSVTVFTQGVHARRSRLVFSKVLAPSTEVGVIAWNPPGYDRGQWTDSSDRMGEFLKESAGYFVELILNSGRT